MWGEDTLTVVDMLDGYSPNRIRPVLWQRDGLFRLVPREVVINALDTRKDPVSGSNICWEQGIDIDPRIARILLGE